MKRIADASTLASRKITVELEREAVKRAKLTNQYLKQQQKLSNLILAMKGNTLQAHALALRSIELSTAFKQSELRTEGLTGKLAALSRPASKLPMILKGIGLAAVAAVAGFAALKTAAGLAAKVFEAIKNVLSWLLSPLKLAAQGVASLASGLWQLARRGISAALGHIADAIGNIAREALAGAETFQKLAIRFEGLMANEVIARGTTSDFASALAIAKQESKGLLSWIQQLAVTTPFTRRDVSETMAFSMAMGFTSREAQVLTKAIGNFTAGMGLSSEKMESIILQFGQMRAGGRLYGTELRDLARGAFVPVNEIIKRVGESLDMTGLEWQELAARGEVSILPFFEEFIKLSGERFPDAMQRMNKTMEAVRQNFKDFVTEFLGVKLLGPAVDALSQQLSSTLDQLLSPRVLKGFEELGKQVGDLTKRLGRFVEQLVLAVTGAGSIEDAVINFTAFFSVLADGAQSLMDMITPVVTTRDELLDMTRAVVGTVESMGLMRSEMRAFPGDVAGVADGVNAAGKAVVDTGQAIADNFGAKIRTLIDNALHWGVNIVTNLAEGIIVGASNALVTAMNFVSGLLAKWLAPGSPPMVAPDLPIWGAAALTEWLKGFKLADFSVLKTIQSPLQGALDVLRMAGKLTRNEVGPLFAKLSQTLIKGFAIGDMGQTFDRISKKLGAFGAEINELIRRELALKSATEAVRVAEEALTRARETHNSAMLRTRRLTDDYNKLMRAGASKAQLDAALAQLNAAEMSEEAAKEQVGVQEDNLAVAKEQLGPLEEAAKLQQELLDQLIAIARAQYDIMVDAGAKGKEIGGGLGEGIVEGLEDMMLGAGEAVDSIFDDLGSVLDDAKGRIANKLRELFKPLVDSWRKEIWPALQRLRKQWYVFKKDVIDPILSGFAGENVAGTVLDDKVRDLRKLAGQLKDEFLELVKVIKVNLSVSFTYLTNTTLPRLERAFGNVKDMLDTLGIKIGEIDLKTLLITGTFIIITGTIDALALSLEIVTGRAADSAESFITLRDNMRDFVDNALSWLIERLNDLIDVINRIPAISIPSIPGVGGGGGEGGFGGGGGGYTPSGTANGKTVQGPPVSGVEIMSNITFGDINLSDQFDLLTARGRLEQMVSGLI